MIPRARSGPSTGTPSARISPLNSRSRPATARNRVDLPQPDGPTSDTSSPGAIVRLTSSSATTGPDGLGKVRPMPERVRPMLTRSPSRVGVAPAEEPGLEQPHELVNQLADQREEDDPTDDDVDSHEL